MTAAASVVSDGRRKRSLRRTARRLAILVLVLATAAAVAIVALLSAAKVETTAHGVPTRLRIPLGPGDAAFPIFVDSGRRVSIPGFLDGPVVRKREDGSWSATWFCEDRALQSHGAGDRLRIDCAGKTQEFDLAETKAPAAVAPMPARLAVLSDLEGNAAFLDRALRKLGIVDATGHWRYGSGQLVVLGDSVDRGRDVFGVLWRLHALAGQADAAGGAVRVVLGNHEQYLLRGNPSRANHEHLHALNAMGSYRQAFAADTVIGRWLRQQPVLLKLGTVLFVHGGISPATARSGLSIAQLNDAMRDYWTAPAQAQHSAALDAVLAPTGVTQYRGYFRGLEGRYPMASDADVALALERFGASRIVVAHTKVAAIESLRGDRVYAVDVNDNAALPQVLVYEAGVAQIVDIGVPRGLPTHEEREFRDFSLGDRADRRLLVDMYGDIRRLSAMPYPY